VDPQCSKAVKTTESVRLPFQVVEPYEDDQEALEVIHVIHLNRDNSFQFFCSFFFTDSHFGVVKKKCQFLFTAIRWAHSNGLGKKRMRAFQGR
jgi:hypothetical protein